MVIIHVAVHYRPLIGQVKTASKHQIPFVPVCGGHSLWSTIGSDGFILDLTSYKSVQVNAAEHQATITGGTLMKELATALASEGECAGMI